MFRSIGPIRAAFLAALTLVLACLRLAAVETRIWSQSDPTDFGRGMLTHLSTSSDGGLSLAPAFRELDDTGVPYLWALAKDSKGNIYYSGGAPTGSSAKLFTLKPGGQSQVFAELNGLEIHALAVDAHDNVYAAVLPDAKVYKIGPDRRPQLFFDAKAKYIWSMLFDRSGCLYVATGEQGIIYQVTANGEGREFFRTEETHARAMVLDESGNLIVGTEPAGLVMRITPAGKSFVLYQTNRREVTALAVRDGTIYAASVGGKPSNVAVAGPATSSSNQASGSAPADTPSLSRGNAPAAERPTRAARSTLSAAPATTGGAEVDRIARDGFAERIWQSPTDVVYCLAFDPAGKLLAGTGNKGMIYRFDSDQVVTELLNTPPTQVTSFLADADRLYAVTGNIGKLYEVGPGVEPSGTLESEVLDVGSFARWGRAHVKFTGPPSAIKLEARSGNLNRPQKNWSPWTPVPISPLGGKIAAPSARFLQYRLTLTQAGAEASPHVDSVEIAYQPNNIAPKVMQIEIAPANYRPSGTSASLERSVTASGSPTTLSLPPLGERRRTQERLASESNQGMTLNYAKGALTARWRASDEDGDSLSYTVEIKQTDETAWRLLRENVTEPLVSWDGNSLADGRYQLRVTASDAAANPPGEGLRGSLVSDPFLIDNTPPEIAAGEVKPDGNGKVLRFTARDALSWLDRAEYSVNGSAWKELPPLGRLTDSEQLDYELHLPPGEQERVVAIRVFDENDNSVVKRFTIR